MKDTINLLISTLALLVAIGSGAFVAVQVRAYLRQLRFDALSRILEVNRQLLLVGFEHPELLTVLEGQTIADFRMQKRYFQMWLNQVHLMWLAHKENLIDETYWDGHSRDFISLANLENFKTHWEGAKTYYEGEFRVFVDSLIQATTQSPSL